MQPSQEARASRLLVEMCRKGGNKQNKQAVDLNNKEMRYNEHNDKIKHCKARSGHLSL
jgi:hypothetical protein